jgi:hypothetical protein
VNNGESSLVVCVDVVLGFEVIAEQMDRLSWLGARAKLYTTELYVPGTCTSLDQVYT